MAIVTMTLEEARRKWTPEKRAQLMEQLEDCVDVYDPDCPPSTDEDLKRFHRVNPHKRRA